MTSTGRLLDLLAIEHPALPAPMAGISGDETTCSQAGTELARSWRV